ncbi:MAG: (Fe-S)-binding protein [Anaerolineae bacterium]
MARIDPSFYTVRQLVELDACTRCGECRVWCPTFAEKESLEAITPFKKIDTVRGFFRRQNGLLARFLGGAEIGDDELAVHTEGVYDCTLCARCYQVCPVGIDLRSLWIAMREQLVDLGRYPEMLDHLRDTVTTHHNISGDPNESRLGWTANMAEVPEGLDRKKHAEVVYFMGCVAPFYPMTYSVPQSFVSILDRAGVNYTTLGGDEYCCGFPLIIAGMGKHAQEMMRHNVEAVRALGAKTLVATCPSCYHTWKHQAPQVVGEPLGFEVLHETELLVDLVEAGALDLKPVDKVVTYHDPCDLGRNSGIYSEPRQLLKAIPGLRFVEMADNGAYALCCGGGGDVEMADAALGGAVGRRRMLQAQETGAKFIITACQQCKRTLLGAARTNKIRIRTLDIAELVWEAMQ